MNNRRVIHMLILVVCVVLSACSISNDKKQLTLKDGDYTLYLNPQNLQMLFSQKNMGVIVPAGTVSGLYVNQSPIVNSVLESKSVSELVLNALTEKDEKVKVNLTFQKGIAKIVVAPSGKNSIVSLRYGGMPVAHGLGDASSYEGNFNIVENKKSSYPIINNGGSNRWVSSFAIFPQNRFAGVCFDSGSKTVTISKFEYSMQVKKEGEATFYYFLGGPKKIYKNYKFVRDQLGYKDVKPKFRLFELGWESWDALGWNTNQVTVQNILEKFHKNDYPIRWAVTGSGFWDQGGTTTSFGRWGEKFPNPFRFKNWMHKNDINWMIGLRTNFIPDGGPYFPETDKRDKNLKVNSFYGNELSTEAKNKGFLVTDFHGDVLEITSTIFPIVPSNLLNGDIPGAARWYQQQYAKWGVDGIKEDTMMNLDSLTGIFNNPITKIADKGALVMARNGAFIAPGTLLRINDTRVQHMSKRTPINYMQYAASGFPNVYSDVAGVHNMHNLKDVDRNIRHTWLLALTSGLSVGAYPEKWPLEKQKLFKKVIDFHDALAPYMYSAAIEGYHSGYPTTLTPLTIAFPEDPEVAQLQNFQWMIGASILAAPLLKNHTSGKMDVYLPEGVWFDYESGQKFKGPKTLIDYKIPLSQIPCFVGGQGIIIERNKTGLTAKIYPISKNTSYQFFDEKGKANGTITIDNPNWKNSVVTNTTTGKKEVLKTLENTIQFTFKKGNDYKIN